MSSKFRHWLEWYPWRVIIGLGVGFAGLSLAAGALIEAFPYPVPALIISYLLTALFLLYALLTIIAMCRVRAGAGGEVALVLIFLLALLITHPILPAIGAALLGAKKATVQYIAHFSRLPGLDILGSMTVILVAGFFGRLVGRLIKEANLLLIVTIVAAGIDLWGVYWGPMAKLTTIPGGPELAKQLSATIPGAAAAAKHAVPVVLSAIGMGDFLFVTMFFSILRRLRMNQVATFWATFSIMLVAPLFFFLGKRLPIATNLPGLPFIGLGTIIANWKHFKFSREEKRAILAAALIIAAVILIIIFITRHHR